MMNQFYKARTFSVHFRIVVQHNNIRLLFAKCCPSNFQVFDMKSSFLLSSPPYCNASLPFRYIPGSGISTGPYLFILFRQKFLSNWQVSYHFVSHAFYLYLLCLGRKTILVPSPSQAELNGFCVF